MATRDTFSLDSFLTGAPSTSPEQLSFPSQPGSSPFLQSPISPLPSSFPTTSWMPLDEFATTWADFGSENAASSLALTATGTAFIALSWEASALRHHTWACQDYCQCRTRNATRWYGQAMEDLTEASRKSEPRGAVAGKTRQRRAAVQPSHPGTGPGLDRPGDGTATAPVAPHPGGAAESPGGWRRQRWTLSTTAIRCKQDAAHAASR